MNIKLEDVILAYKKLKSYAYYDNSSIILREQIIKFEDSSIDKKLKEIYKEIKNNKFDNHISKINVQCLPKKIKKQEDNEKKTISNIPNETIEINSTISVIDIPITLQLIGVIWTIKTRDFFEDSLYDEIYANRIRDVNCHTISLFKPYYENYSKWRDKGISSIENRLKENKNVVYISMDIKDYFYSINMNSSDIGFKKLKDQIEEYYKYKEYHTCDINLILELTSVIEDICNKYSQNVIKNKRCILPIGFIPSLVLSNWYLKDLDKHIVESINPIYYGRYVDDIILVCNIYDTNKNEDEIIDKYLINTKILSRKTKKVKGNDSEVLKVSCCSYKDLVIQSNKVDVKIWDYRYTSAEIDIFKKEINKNRSEFRILPENIEACIGDIYKINYKESKNKIRSLNRAEVDKLELSKSISKIIFKRKQDIYIDSSSAYFDKEIQHIFIYENAIDNFRLWEKIIYYLNQSNNISLRNNLIENLFKAIQKINVNIDFDNQNYKLRLSNDKIKESIKSYLLKNIIIAISMSGAVNNKYIDKIKASPVTFKVDDIKDYVSKIVQSNMMRHNYVAIPLINYCFIEDEKNVFTSFDINILKGLEFDKTKLKYSPRFMHLHEFTLFNFYDDLVNNIKSDIKNDYLIKSKELFEKYNYHNDDKEKIKDKYFEIENKELSIATLDEDTKKYNVNKIRAITEDLNKDSATIAIANVQINDEIIEEIVKGDKSRAYNNFKLFKKILNEAAKNEVDFIALPEVSVPIEWVNFMGEFSRKHNIAIICGLQHFRIKEKNDIYNNLVTIIPIKQDKYVSSIIKFRLKNHYAPFEKEIINRYGFDIPKQDLYYDLFIWRGIHFTCYNCFELASAEERCLMKGHVDIMFASVLNKDIRYFSKIIDSVTRDLHCYFVQVNTSQYGDNRITQPASNDFKDILRIKGGKNSFLVIGQVDIRKLREFQIMDHRAQLNMKNKFFKPTPPNFKVNNSRRKLNLDEVRDNNKVY